MSAGWWIVLACAAAVAGMITGTIVGGAVWYYWGQVTSRNRSGPAVA